MDADALERGSTIGSTDYGEHFETPAVAFEAPER